MTRRLAPFVIVCCAAWLVFRWSSHGAVWLVYDDSFYYFTIARNIAHGLGSTFDQIHTTNGYHPLWLLICTIPYFLGLDDDRAAQVLLSICIVGLGAATMIGLRIIARRAKSAAISDAGALVIGAAFVVFVFSPYAFWRFANGLESSCVLVFFAALADRFDQGLDTPRARIGASLLACGLFLSRTDAIFLVPWLGGVALIRTRALRPTLELVLAPSILIAAYLLFNKIFFGAATQVSGDLKRVVPSASGWLAAALMAGAPIAVMALLSHIRVALIKETAAFISATSPLFGYVACVAAYYERLQVFSWPWYYVGPIFYVALVTAIAMIDLFARIRAIAIAISALAIAMCARMLTYVFSPEQYTLSSTNVDAGRWIRANTEEEAIFGSWDSGAIGYYSHRRVVNLDGEVSSPAYIRALKTGDPISYTRKERFDYVVNVQDQDDGIVRMRKTAASYLGDERLEGSTVVHSWPFIFRGYTNRHAPGEHPMAIFLLRLGGS